MKLPDAKTLFESRLSEITELPLSVRAAASCLVARSSAREASQPLDRLDKALLGILVSGEPGLLTRAYLLAGEGIGELSRTKLIETSKLITQEFQAAPTDI